MRKFSAGDILAIVGMVLITAFAYMTIRAAMDPAKEIRYQASECSEGCRGTAAFDTCFQACMWRGH